MSRSIAARRSPFLIAVSHALSNPDATSRSLTVIPAERPWGEDSRAMLVGEAVDDVRSERQGMAYLLEVGLAREVLDVWSDWRNGRAPTPAESVEAVVHYAEHDAYLPVDPHDARDDAR